MGGVDRSRTGFVGRTLTPLGVERGEDRSGCRRDDELYIHLEGMGAGTLISLARALSESGLRLENHMPMKMKYIHLDSFHFCF